MTRSGTTRRGATRPDAPRRVVVKANYVKTHRVGTYKVKKSAGYYLTRANEFGEVQAREAFSAEEDHLSKAEVYQRLEAAAEGGEYHYRIIFAPDTDQNAENVDMRLYAREMMTHLEVRTQQRIAWLGVEHVGDDAHSRHGHVHIIATTDARLSRSDLQEMRLEAAASFTQALETGADLDMSGKRLERYLEADGGFEL